MPGFGLWLAWFSSWWMGADKFYDVPQNAWFYDGIRRAKREGLLVGYPDGLHRPNPGDRWECAVKLWTVLYNHLHAFEDKGEPPQQLARLVRFRSLIRMYERGAEEFAPQLLVLGVVGDHSIAHLEALSAELESSLPPRYFPFRDVPESHWAAESVSELRAFGLIHGYPDGRFGG